MIDRKARDSLAEQLRHLLAGLITNDEFEERLPISQDVAINKIYVHGVMWLYSHFETHKLSGAWAQPKEEIQHLARWILFLKTDLEYEWQHRAFWLRGLDHLLRTLTLGRVPRKDYVDVAFKMPGRGDIDVWPFFRKKDFDAALLMPPYLRGKAKF